MARKQHEANDHVRRVMEALRVKNNVDRAELADVLKMSTSTLSERMSGTSRFTVAEVALAAEFFEEDAGLFFTDPKTWELVPRPPTPGSTPYLPSPEDELVAA